MCRLSMTVNAKVSDSRKSQGTETQGQECPQLSVLTPAGKVTEAPAALGGGRGGASRQEGTPDPLLCHHLGAARSTSGQRGICTHSRVSLSRHFKLST